jgi:hypothetical protein
LVETAGVFFLLDNRMFVTAHKFFARRRMVVITETRGKNMLMIELSINDGSYDRILDAPFKRLEAEDDVAMPDDAAAADEFIQPQESTYPMAPGIAWRGYQQRPLRRASRIL